MGREHKAIIIGTPRVASPDQVPRKEAGIPCFFTLHSPEESHLTTQTVTATLKSPQQTAQGIRKSIPTVVALPLQHFEWTAGLPRTAHARLKLFYSQ